MQVDWNKVKHGVGVVALMGIPAVAAVPKYGPWIALGLGFVAYVCGALAEKLFTQQVAETVTRKDLIQ